MIGHLRLAAVLVHVLDGEGVERLGLPRIHLGLHLRHAQVVAEVDALLDALAEGVLWKFGGNRV